MRFISTKLTVLLLLAFLTFGLSTKAQTIVPASQITSWQALPDKEATGHFFNDNLYATLIVDQAKTIARCLTSTVGLSVRIHAPLRKNTSATERTRHA